MQEPYVSVRFSLLKNLASFNSALQILHCPNNKVTGIKQLSAYASYTTNFIFIKIMLTSVPSNLQLELTFHE